ncbi:hypothetical protein RND81_08G102600 [Saponaria officinalis]|uniref:Uncharacterized protein n=1 Tax=Saponaria officinalis TaxID=3572 RepID=A0AAW1J5Q1_SAPOF
MSSSSSWHKPPIDGIEYKNQCCNKCGRNALIKIYGSVDNPRKAYFKCLDCNHFVMWLTEDHMIITQAFKQRCIQKLERKDAVMVGLNNEDIIKLQKLFVDFTLIMKFYMKCISMMIIIVIVMFLLK